MRPINCAISCLVILWALSGCGRGDTAQSADAVRADQPAAKSAPAQEQAPPAQEKVPPKVPEIPVQSLSPFSRIPLPPGFPEDIPIYAGAIIKSANQAPQGRSRQVNYTVKDKLDLVAQFYREKAPAAGWIVHDEAGSGPSVRLRLEKEQRQVYMTLDERGGLTHCGLIVGR